MKQLPENWTGNTEANEDSVFLTQEERATALRNNINWAIEYSCRIDDSIQKQMDYLESKAWQGMSYGSMPMANRDLKSLMEIIDSIKELTEDDEVYSYD